MKSVFLFTLHSSLFTAFTRWNLTNGIDFIHIYQDIKFTCYACDESITATCADSLSMIIELNNLSLAYDSKAPLFRDLNLSFNSNDFVLIQGPSGSGKSSLLRLLNRLQEPSSGTILIDNRPIDQYEITTLRRRIGYVQQVPVMVEGDVRKNLQLPFQFKASQDVLSPQDEDLRTWLNDFLLEEVALEDDAQLLSVGQKQRLALIRTLLTQPEVILCDEPTSALDNQSRTVVESWLERLNLAHNTGIVMVTHLDFAPAEVRPRKFMLEPGGLVESM